MLKVTKHKDGSRTYVVFRRVGKGKIVSKAHLHTAEQDPKKRKAAVINLLDVESIIAEVEGT